MFKEMRRKNQLLSNEDSIAILNKGTSGTLALHGDNNYPYAVPISYVYSDGKLYFHSATSGHKIDAVKRNAKASFCVIDEDNIVPDEYTTYFRSVIAFGKTRIMENEEEIGKAMNLLAKKYYPEDTDENRSKTITDAYPRLCVLEFEIEHLTGKEAIELAAKRN